jgi:hypothetical protein
MDDGRRLAKAVVFLVVGAAMVILPCVYLVWADTTPGLMDAVVFTCGMLCLVYSAQAITSSGTVRMGRHKS